MTPDRQAQLLADWLQQEPGTEPHAELDSDAVEAVYALRPDLAPAPRLTIEDVLAEVREGPFAAEDAQAVTALVDWLEDNPGAEPPADVDPDVVEAVYALRPDLAPPPRVDLADIFDAVKTGPFAAGSSATVGPGASPAAIDASTPKTGEGGQVVSLAAARARPPVAAAPTRVRRPARWVVPGLGGLAVAAVALMLVLPNAQPVLDAPTPFAASETVAQKPAAEPAPAAVDEDAAPSPSRSVKRMTRPSPIPDPKADAPRKSAETSKEARLATGSGSVAVGGEAEEKAESAGTGRAVEGLLGNTADRQDAVRDEAPAEDVLLPVAPRGAGPTTPSSQAAPADMREQAQAPGALYDGALDAASLDAADEDELQDAEGYAGAAEREASRAESVETESLTRGSRRERKDLLPDLLPTIGKKKSAPAEAPAMDEDYALSDDFASAESSGMELDSALGGAVTQQAPAVTAPPLAPPPPAAAAASSSTRSAGSTASPSGAASSSDATVVAGSDAASLDALRSQAWPLGASPDVTIGRPDVAAAHAAAAQADAQGDAAAWLAAMRPLLGHADDVVAQDAAIRIARRQLSQGQARAALATVELGLRRGSSGALAARLYTLQGQAWERLGAAESAAGSYQRAIQAR